MTRYRALNLTIFAAALSLSISAAFADTTASVTQLQPIGRNRICVTNGAVSSLPDGRLGIQTPSSRAVAPGSDGTAAELHFRYLGPAIQVKPLASGEIRRQIGVKLRAQDACNLLYAMWHIAPDAKIEVSVKKNPAQHASAECHAGGYLILKPSRVAEMPAIHPGEAHTLRVALNGADLIVIADGREAWAGTVGSDLDGIAGPAGFRSDNARFELEFLAAAPVSGGPSSTSKARCDSRGPT